MERGIQVDIKRVLWIDDVAQNRASRLFPEEETRIVTSLDAAIKEISGPNLYHYDTIVLDIDFENGLHDATLVLKELTVQLFLDKDQRNNSFLITNGGYLLYLYLLKRGYPSDQIAFLTGNPAMVEQLRAYTRKNEKQLTKESIEKVFLELWDKYADDLDSFEQEIEKLPIKIEYKQSDFLIDCEQALDNGDLTLLSQIITVVHNQVSEQENTEIEEIKNTGDMMIFRFHQANLEAPAYFSKQENDISGHDITDAEDWLNSLRTTDQVTRWLLLSASNKIEQLFSKTPYVISSHYNQIYKTGDLGMRAAFKQMFYVLDGLRSGAHKEVYFQAISALLVPYEASPDNSVDDVTHNNEIRVSYLSAWCAKIARNLLAHNRFGTVISAKTSLFIVLMAVTAILPKQERIMFDAWYRKCFEAIEKMIIGGNGATVGNDKIKALIELLFSNNEINVSANKARPYTTYQQYNFRNTLYALTNNIAVENASIQSVNTEDYYLFSLAVGFVRWFLGQSDNDILTNYGSQIEGIYQIALKIVNSYNYPLRTLI